MGTGGDSYLVIAKDLKDKAEKIAELENDTAPE